MKSLRTGASRGVAASAYTLPEVLVSIFVVGVFVISLFAGFGSGFSLLRLTREDARAAQIIQQKIETLRLCSWDQLASFPTSFQEHYDPLVSTNDPRATVFNGTVNFTTPEIPTSYATNLRLATITVSWTNYDTGKPVVHTNRGQIQVARYGTQLYDWRPAP